MAISFKKEIILEAIQQVLAEAETVKKVIGPKGGSIAQAVSPEEEIELKKAGAKIEPMEEDHAENPNDESDMAKSQLYAIAKYAIELLQMIKDGDPLDAWVQAKITKAADYVDAVQHYLEGEKYLDANQEEPEEELAEGDYEPRTKEDLVFQYLRDAWQLGALKGKDVNPDEELSIMTDSLLTYLPDYDSAELEEARRGQSTVQTDLDNVKAKMRELAKQYSAGDKSVLAQLKDLNDEKKALEKELIYVVSKIGAGQELDPNAD